MYDGPPPGFDDRSRARNPSPRRDSAADNEKDGVSYELVMDRVLRQCVPAETDPKMAIRRTMNQPVLMNGTTLPYYDGHFSPMEKASLGIGCRKTYYAGVKERAQHTFKHYPFCFNAHVQPAAPSEETPKN